MVWEDRFLVVDDNEPLRELVSSLLSRKGIVETASGANEGLKKVQEHYYNVIISDIQMPGMDGIEFYKRVVEYDPQLKRHFLFFSADITSERQTYLKNNELSFLRKPFSLSEFMASIDHLIKQ